MSRSQSSEARERRRAYDKARYPREKERRIAHARAYYQAHKSRIAARERIKRRTNPQVRLSVNLRTRINRAIANNQKAGSAVRDLGCSVADLRKHLETLFAPGMSWENYGRWHIDHIIPLCHFDLTQKDQFLKACHYSNLQPLWAEANYRKGGRLS